MTPLLLEGTRDGPLAGPGDGLSERDAERPQSRGAPTPPADEGQGTGTPVPPFDVISYAGEISVDGYERLSHLLATRQAQADVLLVLSTAGGDPHAAFRIARALQHTYGRFFALVPRCCKSAGTLVLLGACALYLDDMAELGPLDVQVSRTDELMGRRSGLEFLNAIDSLQSHCLEVFRGTLSDLLAEGIAPGPAADIASRLTDILLRPIAAQMNPLKIAEMQRAVEIASSYGQRLAERAGNVRPDALMRLVLSYPSHGFAIDRREARGLFFDVRPAGPLLGALSATIVRPQTEAGRDEAADVRVFSFPGPFPLPC